jgi:hypothetical protein
MPFCQKIIAGCILELVPSWLRSQRGARRIKRSLGVTSAMEIIINMCWSMWTVRNSWLFNDEDPTIDNCKIIKKTIHKCK